MRRRWRKSHAAGRYRNRDLWEELQARIDELRSRGYEVSFWLVHGGDDRESHYIAQAKEAARIAARQYPGEQVDKFTKLCGIML